MKKDSFDFVHFWELLTAANDDDGRAALEYKNAYVPKILFKYYSFSESMKCQKLLTIVNNQLWLSGWRDFNDPFELQAVYACKELYEMDGGNPELASSAYNAAQVRAILNRESFRITSYSECCDSVPMWAYYADNHKGICMAYRVQNPDKIFPVSYLEDKLPSFIPEYMYSYPVSQKVILRLSVLYAIKHKSWQHEKEYRVIENGSGGTAVGCEKLGLEPVQILAGCRCEERLLENLHSVQSILTGKLGFSMKPIFKAVVPENRLQMEFQAVK